MEKVNFSGKKISKLPSQVQEKVNFSGKKISMSSDKTREKENILKTLKKHLLL
jgi:hypothetical protein